MLIASLAITNCMFVVVFSIIYVYNHNCHVGEWVWLECGLLGLFCAWIIVIFLTCGYMDLSLLLGPQSLKSYAPMAVGVSTNHSNCLNTHCNS